MDCIKIGNLIASLRKEKKLTQQNIADALNISNKTVSKWECGLGCPDVSLWNDLSIILGVDIAQMIQGEITPNKADIGNISNIRFYVCPQCYNILTSTGSASIHCCGRKLEQLEVLDDMNKSNISYKVSDIDYYVTFDHEMSREHYILFVAHVYQDRISLIRLYPEQSPSVRLPYQNNGQLYLYCIKHGLHSYKIN